MSRHEGTQVGIVAPRMLDEVFLVAVRCQQHIIRHLHELERRTVNGWVVGNVGPLLHGG